MKTITFLILFIISFSSLAAVKIEIRFKDQKIKQGTIVPATLVFDAESSQKLPLNKLVGETLGKAFYVYAAKSLITKDNWSALESEAQVIVASIPESKPVEFKIGDVDGMVLWNDVEFIPTEANGKMIYGNFEIPSRAKIIQWVLIFVAIVVAALVGLKIKSRVSKKNAIKKRRAVIKEEIMAVRDYPEVVKVWQKKNEILREFPALETNFKNLESVLFKYQFKPSQSETEKLQVMNAWRDFVSQSQGGLNGV